MGIGQVIESHQKMNLYPYVYVSVAAKIAQENDTDIYFGVVQGNEIPEYKVNKSNISVIDSQRWIAVTNSKADALKNHL